MTSEPVQMWAVINCMHRKPFALPWTIRSTRARSWKCYLDLHIGDPIGAEKLRRTGKLRLAKVIVREVE